MTLRRTIGRALHAMTSTSAPAGWEADPRTETTSHAARRLHTPGLGETPHMAALAAQHGDRSEVAVLRESLADTKAELADTRRQLRLAEAAVARLDAAGEAVERRNAILTRDVALRTTQRDKARSDRDRLQAQLEDMTKAAPC